LVGEDERFDAFELVTVPPVRLVEHGVDLLDVNGSGLSSNGFDHAADTEVFCGSEVACVTFVDEVDGGFGEGIVGEFRFVEFAEDEVFDLGGGKTEDFTGVGDTAKEVGIGLELEAGHEFGLADEDEVVVFGEVFHEESELTQYFDVNEVGVVYDEDECFSFLVKLSDFC